MNVSSLSSYQLITLSSEHPELVQQYAEPLAQLIAACIDLDWNPSWSAGGIISLFTTPVSYGYCFVSADTLFFTPSSVAGVIMVQENGDLLDILMLAVAPTQRRQGLALQLLQLSWQSSWDRGCRECILEVDPQNYAALGFYQQAGFKIIGTRPDYYIHRRTRETRMAYVMARTMTIADSLF